MLNSHKYVEPGYLVYRAFIFPYREDGQPISVRKVTEKDVEGWKRTLDNLHEFLTKYWGNLTGKDTMTIEDKLSIIADLMAIFFKLPLIREPLPQITHNPIKVYLTLHSLCHQSEMAKFIREKIKKPVNVFGEKSIKDAVDGFLKSEFVKLLDNREIASLIEKAWFVFPSDTRPGFNTSSLLSHMLLTSAIAWSLAVQRGMDGKRAATLRLSSILHDAGKPLDPEHHYEVGAKLVKPLLQGILSETEIREITSFVKEHHIDGGTDEAQILREADRYAAAIDRVSEMVENLLRDTVNSMAAAIGLEAPKDLKGTKWEFWRKLYADKEKLKQTGLIKEEDPLKELCSKFVEEVGKEEDPSRPQLKLEVVKGISAFLLDVGGIQNYVMRSNKLPNTVAASFTVDLLVMVFLLLHIQLQVKFETKLWLPYESFIYAAGGIIFLIAPDRLQGYIEEVGEELSKDYEDLPIRVVSTSFVTTYPTLSEKLAKSMEAKKFTVTREARQVDRSYLQSRVLNLCQLCNLNADATYDQKLRSNTCKSCRELYDVGSEFHFAKRWDAAFPIHSIEYVPSKVFNMDWGGEASERIMEIISGHDKSELEGLKTGEIEYRNIALLKLDGNLMGVFMAKAISISDAFERSARIDLALKKAYETALNALLEGVKTVSNSITEAVKAVFQVKLGTLYMGGDDALIFMPSWVSLPFALVVGKEFAANMGRVRSLSIGIAVASPTHDVWLLVEAANELMDNAKGLGRREIAAGALCFDVVSSGMLSSHIAAERFKLLERSKLSTQPFLFEATDRSDTPLIGELLEKIVTSFKTYEELFGRAYLASRFKLDNTLQKEIRALLKKIRGTIKEVIAAPEEVFGSTSEHPLIQALAYLYNVRQIERRKGGKTLHYEITGWSLTRNTQGKLSIADLDRAVEILGGGAL